MSKGVPKIGTLGSILLNLISVFTLLLAAT